MQKVEKGRLLWVDDEIDLLRPHLLFVQGRGYHIDAVANGDDALELIRLHPYDLVLLDEQMPGRSGMEVLDELRRMDPRVPVVMVTKSEEDRTMTEAWLLARAFQKRLRQLHVSEKGCLLDTPGPRLFRYREDGRWHDLDGLAARPARHGGRCVCGHRDVGDRRRPVPHTLTP